MQWKLPSSLAAITSLFLLSAVHPVAAQISAPFCTDTGSWLWSFNSLDQNPCTVVAYLMAACYNEGFYIPPLGGSFAYYAGPTIEDTLAAGSCWCNTVVYNLYSACSECQGGLSISWAEYDEYCTTTQPPSTFPNPVPAGTSVPRWVLLGIPSTDYWSPTSAELVGDSPEILPGELLDEPAILPTPTYTVVPVPTLTTPTLSHTFVQAPTSSIPSSGNELNQGTIVGAGGVVVTTMAAITGLVLTLFS